MLPVDDNRSLLSMLIETDYNFKKITAVFFGSRLKEFHSVWNCLFIKQNAQLFQHNHLLLEICWGYLFRSIRLSLGCSFHPVVDIDIDIGNLFNVEYDKHQA